MRREHVGPCGLHGWAPYQHGVLEIWNKHQIQSCLTKLIIFPAFYSLKKYRWMMYICVRNRVVCFFVKIEVKCARNRMKHKGTCLLHMPVFCLFPSRDMVWLVAKISKSAFIFKIINEKYQLFSPVVAHAPFPLVYRFKYSYLSQK